jgi:hypothetical protein
VADSKRVEFLNIEVSDQGGEPAEVEWGRFEVNYYSDGREMIIHIDAEGLSKYGSDYKVNYQYK